LPRLLIHGVGRSGTTFTQQVVNSHPDIWITNEFLLYDAVAGVALQSVKKNPRDALDYFHKLSIKTEWNQSKEHYWDVPPTFDEDFFYKCHKEYSRKRIDREDRREWIWTVEKILFSKYKYWGDKVLEVSTLQKLKRFGLDFKVIYVLRDGRDNVCSRRRANFGGGAQAWYWGVKEFIDFSDSLPMDYYRVVKFEDLISKPNPVIRELSSWIGVSAEPMLKGFYSKVRENGIGRWRHELSDWYELFKGKPLVMLRKLDYI
jgi:hypothetical protein